MKYFNIALVMLIFCSTTIFAQDNDSVKKDTIEIRQGKGMYNYYYQGKPLKSNNELKNVMKSNDEAYDLMSSAKSWGGWGIAFSYPAGFLIGWPIGTWAGGGEPNWNLAAVGAGLFGVAVIFSLRANSLREEAISTFNSDTRNITSSEDIEVSFTFYGTGAGVLISF